MTENAFGKGSLLYEGTVVNDALQEAMVNRALQASGITVDAAAEQSKVRVKRGVDGEGKRLTYLLNYSSAASEAKYVGPAAHDLLTGAALSDGQMVKIGPWDLVIAESDAAAKN